MMKTTPSTHSKSAGRNLNSKADSNVSKKPNSPRADTTNIKSSPQQQNTTTTSTTSSSSTRSPAAAKPENIWISRAQNAKAANTTNGTAHNAEQDMMARLGLGPSETHSTTRSSGPKSDHAQNHHFDSVEQKMGSLSLHSDGKHSNQQHHQQQHHHQGRSRQHHQQHSHQVEQTNNTQIPTANTNLHQHYQPNMPDGTSSMMYQSIQDQLNGDEGDRAKNKVKLSLAEFHSAMDNETEDETPSRILWVGNIGPDVSERDLENEFGRYGKIESLRILHSRYCAFVNFEEEEPAKQAKQQLHGKMMGSQHIVVNFRRAEGRPIVGPDSENIILNKPSRALWIGNISNEVTEEELSQEFSQFGEIESVRLLRAKTCAFVNFIRLEDATRALHTLQGKVMGNMAIKINFGKPQLPPKKRGVRGELDFNEFYQNASALPPYMQMGATQSYLPPEYGGYNSFSLPPGSLPPGYGMPPPNMDPYSMYIPSSVCELCAMNYKEYAFAPCGHACCSECLAKLRAATVMSGGEKGSKCPYCSQNIQKYLEISYAPPPFSSLMDPMQMGGMMPSTGGYLPPPQTT